MDSFLNWHPKDWNIDPVPSIVGFDAVLQLRGILLAQECHRGSVRDVHTNHKIQIWIRMLRLASNERSELSSRSAAASSIQGFQTVLRQYDSNPVICTELLDVYLCLYDTLLDDDEEIRHQGASIVSWVLSEPAPNAMPDDNGSLSLSPLAANVRFLSFLASSYRESTALCIDALRRLTGTRCLEAMALQVRSDFNCAEEAVCLQLPSVGDQLRTARQEDTALFVEEKQNLFKDEVQEAERWADVLRQLSSTALDSSIPAEINTWVLGGLAILTDTAKAEFDGPLGWTTKPPVFTLGMQVILAAEVVLYWIRMGYCKIDDEKMKSALTTLEEVGKHSSLHVIWLKRLEQIIKEF